MAKVLLFLYICKFCQKGSKIGVQNNFNFWGERSTSEYLLSKWSFDTYMRIVSAIGNPICQRAFMAVKVGPDLLFCVEGDADDYDGGAGEVRFVEGNHIVLLLCTNKV